MEKGCHSHTTPPKFASTSELRKHIDTSIDTIYYLSIDFKVLPKIRNTEFFIMIGLEMVLKVRVRLFTAFVDPN